MENMENNELPQESAYTTELLQNPAETARRSPYENSPYMMPHRPQNTYQTPAAEPVPPQPPKAKKSRKKGRGRAFFGVLAVIFGMSAMVCGASALTAGYLEKSTSLQIQALEEQINVLRQELEAQNQSVSGESVSGTPNTGIDGGMTPGQVYAKNEKAVVLVDTDVSTGSGFIITADGYVVTNHHVIEGAGSIHVVLYDNSRISAELVGSDASNDVAVLKMQGDSFQSVVLGSSDDLIVGDQVVAIGNPLGELTSTLTVGFVSAKERDVNTDSSTINMMQTDCAINSGNSGGPLFNMRGEVVGITTAKYSGTSVSGASIEGIGFAIPLDDVAGIIEDLMEFGYVKGTYLGVSVYSVDADTSRRYNIPLGCLVDSVTPGSCAAVAGVKDSDVIIALGGHTVEGYTDLARALRKFEPGDTTTITVYRAGQQLVLPITLDERPTQTQSAAPSQPELPSSGSYEEWFNYFFGE